jgi:putative ABC transport system substrate-binding protein
VGVILYSSSFYPAFQGFKDGLNEIGYEEGDDITYHVENINGNLKVIKSILEKFKKENVCLIFTTTSFVALTVKKNINKYKIPVIFNEVGAPVLSNVVKSFNKPGGYLTGVSHLAYKLIPKRLDIFKDSFPFLKNIVFFYNPDKKYIKNQLDFIVPISKKLKLNLIPVPVTNRSEMIKAVQSLAIPENSGLFMFPDAVAMKNVDLLVTLYRKKKIPFMVLDNVILPKCGCIGYSPSFYKVGKQSAFIAKKILSGVFPGDIPVQMPLKIELFVNLKEIINLGLYENFNKKYLIYADKVYK